MCSCFPASFSARERGNEQLGSVRGQTRRCGAQLGSLRESTATRRSCACAAPSPPMRSATRRRTPASRRAASRGWPASADGTDEVSFPVGGRRDFAGGARAQTGHRQRAASRRRRRLCANADRADRAKKANEATRRGRRAETAWDVPAASARLDARLMSPLRAQVERVKVELREIPEQCTARKRKGMERWCPGGPLQRRTPPYQPARGGTQA